MRGGPWAFVPGASLLLAGLLAAQPTARPPGTGAPPGGRAVPPTPKAGVCPLPILPALPAYTDHAFFAKTAVPHGKIEQAHYQNYAGEEKRMHVYLPPDYASNGSARYPVLYLNHGGGDDDSKWSSEDLRSGGYAGDIIDNLIAAGKAKPMIVVMPNTRACATFEPSPIGTDDKCSQEYLKDIIPYVDSHYRTKASREYRALAGLSMGGMVVIHTGFPHLDTFSELYIYSSGHISEATRKKFDEYYGAMLQDPSTNDKFRVPLYMAAGETDIALHNGQKDLALFDLYGLRNFWVLSSGGHEWANWRRYLYQTAQIMFPDCPAQATSAANPAPSPRHIDIDVARAVKPLDRFFDLSVGSDYPGTLIRDDSQAQLKTAVDELGFRYIRFHAIFHDVSNTVRAENGKTVYDWTKIDQLYDDLLARRIKPFVELGFTPKAMKTSDNTIFYWRGNTSHPVPAAWRNLVGAFIRHIEKRYGRTEVRTWFFEVWNEPNLSGFWEGADQKAYFELYDLTSKTIKAIDPRLRVGGPSTAGAAWVPEFLNHVAQSAAAVDFVTTHTYGVDGGFLDENGKEDTKLSPSPDAILGDVRRVRAQIQASKFPNLPLYFTEWSTSYTPRDLVHDSYISAPYILSKLKASQGLLQGMSYWTYTDLFEEPGPPPSPFHGGFGLLNREGIRKPAYFAYKYLHAVQGSEVPVQDGQVFAAAESGGVSAVIWDFQQPRQKVSNRPFYSRMVPAEPAPPVELRISHLQSGSYKLTVQRTGYRANDAYSAYIDMGAPKELSPAQLEELKNLTRDLPETDRVVDVPSGGAYEFSLPMKSNDVVLVTLRKTVE
ncbi:MAG TPA: alpha/beta hydrolase-fold protein [Bryobacteraceae bacterium]|nr:alpha/beta hydrolase-fold protein [Bryobacteraceae bacterium]